MASREDRIQYLRDEIETIGIFIDELNEDILYAERQIQRDQDQESLAIEEQHILNTELQDLLKEEDHEE